MKRWLRDNPWIWIVLFLMAVVMSSFVIIVIATVNAPMQVPR